MAVIYMLNRKPHHLFLVICQRLCTFAVEFGSIVIQMKRI
jgi:hypothetical protein